MARKRRPPKGKKINPTLYVFCEGETEESYINLLKREYRIASIQIHPRIGGNNITEKYIQNYKQGRPTHKKDLHFLFYDLDAPNMYKRLANISNSVLLFSNPCVELWFLLHYKSHTAHTKSEYCCRELINYNKGYQKGVIDGELRNTLITRKNDAIKRAKRLTGNENPSTSVYKFIEKLEELKR